MTGLMNEVENFQQRLEANPMDTGVTRSLIDSYRKFGDLESLGGAWKHLCSITALSASDLLQRLSDGCMERTDLLSVPIASIWQKYLETHQGIDPSAKSEAQNACMYDLRDGWKLWSEYGETPSIDLPYLCHCSRQPNEVSSDILKMAGKVKSCEDQLDGTWETFRAYLREIDTFPLSGEILGKIKQTILKRALLEEEIMRKEAPWLAYLDLIQFGHPEYAHVVRDAINTCRQSVKLRCQSFLVAESTGKWEKMEQALVVSLKGFDPVTFDDLVQLYLSYCISAKRLLWSSNADAARNVIRNAAETLDQLGPDKMERIRGFWMRLEYSTGDFRIGRELMARSKGAAGNDLRWWLGAIYLEITAKEYAEARKMYKEALTVIPPESFSRLIGEWEQLELQQGTLSDWLEFQQIKKQYPHDEKVFEKKRPEPEPVQQLQKSQAEKRTRMEQIEFDPQTTVFLSNLSFKASEEEIRSFMRDIVGEPSHVVITMDKNGNSRGLAHVVFPSEDLVHKAIAHDRALLLGRPVFVNTYQPVPKAERQRVEFQRSRDPKVLFISQLPDETTKEDIDALFSGFIGWKTSRLVISKSGHFRGSAYVEFEDEQSAASALSLDKSIFKGVKIRVQISDPEAAKGKAASLMMLPRTVKASRHARSRIET